MPYELRPHQKEQNKQVRKELKKRSHLIYSAPTGWGKSICIWDFAKRAMNDGKKVLVIAPTRKLVTQIADTLAPLKPLMYLGSVVKGNRASKLVVSSRQTMANRLKNNVKAFLDVDMIIIDEVHIAGAMPPRKGSQFSKLFDMYWNKADWIGFSGTPIDAQGYRLEGWDHTISMYQTGELIKMGWLADYEYYAPAQIDLSKLKVNSMGEYTSESMDEIVLKSTAITSIHKQWVRYKDSKKIIIFASSIAHAEVLKKSLGVDVSIIHSKLGEAKVEEILQEFEKATTATIINVSMLTTGFDSPSVDCLILARPIKSITLALQIYGRALRPYKDKVSLILDMCNVHENCGLPKQVRNFNLKKPERGEKKELEEKEEKPMVCLHCENVILRSDLIVNEKVKKKYTLTTYICPICKQIIDEVRQDLSVVDNLVKIKEVEVVKLTSKERGDIVRRLVREQTNYKEGVVKFVGQAFKKGNAFALFDQIVAEDKDNEARMWRRLWAAKKRIEKGL